MKNKILIISLFVLVFSSSVYSQTESVDSLQSNYSIGIKAGVSFPWLGYTNPNLKDYKSFVMGRQLFGAYLEARLKNNWSIRPELLYIGKGQKIDNLGISYALKSNYFELRLPIVYSYKTGRVISPYAILGPTLSLASGGKITFDNLETKITKANLSTFDFGLVAGVGVKVPLKVQRSPLMLGAELAYTHGFNNTYGESEKNGAATALNRNSYTIEGTRKNRGVEFSLSLAMPLCKKVAKPIPPKKAQEVLPVKAKPDSVAANAKLIELPAINEPKPIVIKNDCYEMDEILSFLNSGVDVNDKKICMNIVGFDFNKSEINKFSAAYLNKIIQLLQKYPSLSMKIVGHADSIGSDEVNLNLSKKRAFSVYSYLMKAGASSARLSYEYFGSRMPIASNETESGRKLNRRVEFIIKNGVLKLDVNKGR